MTQLDAVARIVASRRLRLRRERVVTLVLAAAVALVAIVSLSLGSYTIAPLDILRTLVGQGSGGESFVLFQLRLPRLALAIVVGVAFAVSGALFQGVLRNPLASPDIIGVTGGASAAAVYGLLILGFGGIATSLAAFGGAIVVAAAIYLLAWRGGVAGYRFVLIGIAIQFMVNGLLGYLLTRADLRDTQEAYTWLVGSVSGAEWTTIGLVALTLVVLLPLVALLSPRLRALQLGDDAAASLGIRPERTRLGLIVLAVALAAVATAAVGPIAFVAFVSAPIARRVTRSGGLSLVTAALVGALVTTVADLVAQHLLPGNLQLPVGIVTGAIGAPYLLWLLATSNKSGKGA